MFPRLGASFQQGVKMGGCSKFFYIVLGLFFVLIAMSTPILWVFLLIGVAAAVFAYIVNNRTKQKDLLLGLDQQAIALESLAAGTSMVTPLAISLAKGEKPICVLPSVALTEYESTGSSFSGGTAGISFPLTDTIGGNLGGMKGSFTRNPEQLMIVDQGKAIFTNQRILFSGAKFVRDWSLKDTVSLEPGPNGFDVKIAVTNRERTSGLRGININDFGPGYAAAYAFNLSQNGLESANQWARDLAEEIRVAVSLERAKKSK
jgi:hypothetical protein